MTRAFHNTGRSVLRVSGEDRIRFLQDLVTNSVAELGTGPVYAALLTPQGKYLSDFFLIADTEAVLIDVATAQAPALAQRLNMYKLRAKLSVEETSLRVVQGLGAMPAGAWPDPRLSALGWRVIVEDAPAAIAGIEPLDPAEWDALRIRCAVPEAGAELIPGESYILEMGFDRLNGVDFRKGCYVGQEVTARMRHKTELRKGLSRLTLKGEVAPGTEITSEGKPAGQVTSVAGSDALAYLRFDRVRSDMRAGDVPVDKVE